MPIAQVIQENDYDNHRTAVPVKVWTDHVEPSARQQLVDLSRMPFIHKHVAVMPDVHWGNGTSVGTVIATKKAIIPAAVGVDLGCGMMAVKLDIKAEQLPTSLAAMRSAIEAAVPHGRSDGGPNDIGGWRGKPTPGAMAAFSTLWADSRYTGIVEAQVKFRGDPSNQMGTLGTGNHFVEVCLDKEGYVWVMLHSGSRGIGNAIGRTFIDKAKEAMEHWHISLPNKDLAYLPHGTQLFNDYWYAVEWAQDYAAANRRVMMRATLDAIANTLGIGFMMIGGATNCHHNYVALENHFGENVYVTRKGAVRAREGELGIIPGSMGARSFIVRGKGNPESFCSCSHGAGRKMSRTEAKALFTVEDLEQQTAGVECRKDADVIDEAPGAYKDIEQVMANQADLVEVVAELKQVLCVKG